MSTSRLFQAAHRLFKEYGYGCVTMGDLAKALNMKKASLYYHAPGGKEQIYMQVMNRHMERHQQGLQDALLQAGPCLKQRLYTIATWMIQNAPLNLLPMLKNELPHLSLENQQQLQEQFHRCIWRPVRSVFEDAQERGLLRENFQVENLTGMFLSIMDGITFMSAQGYAQRMERMMQESLDLFLLGAVVPAQQVNTLSEPKTMIRPTKSVLVPSV